MTSDYATDARFDQAPPNAADELRNAHDHLHQAAGAAADHLLPHDVRHHVRSAFRHLFSAGIAALDHLDRRAQEHAASRAAGPVHATGTSAGAGPDPRTDSF